MPRIENKVIIEKVKKEKAIKEKVKGKKFDNLSRAEKDELLLLLLEMHDMI